MRCNHEDTKARRRGIAMGATGTDVPVALFSFWNPRSLRSAVQAGGRKVCFWGVGLSVSCWCSSGCRFEGVGKGGPKGVPKRSFWWFLGSFLWLLGSRMWKRGSRLGPKDVPVVDWISRSLREKGYSHHFREAAVEFEGGVGGNGGSPRCFGHDNPLSSLWNRASRAYVSIMFGHRQAKRGESDMLAITGT
jgi:hypothetical protein